MLASLSASLFSRNWQPAIACVAVALSSTFVSGRVAHADDVGGICLASYNEAQRLRHDSDLLGARSNLRVCARTDCPAVVVEDCTTWLRQMEESIPSLILAAQDGRGTDVGDVRVRVDGRVLTEVLDGHPLEVNPGPHVFHYERAGSKPIEERLIVNQGERNRLVRIRFTDASLVTRARRGTLAENVLPSPSRPASTLSPLALGLGASAVVALGLGAYFEARGLSGRSALESSCFGHCNADAIASAKEKLVAGDVLVGVGLLFAGGAIWSQLDSARGTPPASANPTVSVVPTVGTHAARADVLIAF